MRGHIFRRYFEDLFAGDPVALGATVGILLMVLFVGLVWWKTAREFRQDEERRRKRRGTDRGGGPKRPSP